MATGDNILTAISVALQCNILSAEQKVFYADMKDDQIVWNVSNESEIIEETQIGFKLIDRLQHPASDEEMVKR